MIAESEVLSATIRRYWSKTFVVALGVNAHFHKLVQIGFTAADGSIYVSLPYFRHTHGIAAELPIPPITGGPETIDLSEYGWRTVQRVKYSHHVSGVALFSQTNKVRPVVRKQAARLTDINGHLFSLYLSGVIDFETLKRPKDLAYDYSKRTTILLAAPGGDPGWFRLVARWYTLEQYVTKHRAVTTAQSGRKTIQPQVTYFDAAGAEYQRILLSPPPGTPFADCVLELAVVRMTIPTTEHETGSSMVFIAGFDADISADDGERSSSCLALKYPVASDNDIWEMMRSLDL